MEINVDNVVPNRALEIMKDALTVHRNSDFNMPFFLHGQPGVGKSDLVEQLAAWAGMELKIQMLTQIEATDLRGLQFVDDETQKTVNYPPSWLPGPDDPPTIIFLDELCSAEPRLQVSGYQLLLQGRIGEFVLDRKHYVCGASNRPEDGAIVYGMTTALADRLLHIVVVPSVDSWLEWAQENGIHPSVMTFLRLHGHMLSQLEEQMQADHLIGPTPRSWHRVSQIMHTLEGQSRARVEPLVQGWLGKHVTSDFFLTVEEMAGLPDPSTILNMDPKEFEKIIPKELTNLWGLAFSLVAFATDVDKVSKAFHFFRIMVEKGPTNQPLEDVRKMSASMLMKRAIQGKFLNDLLDHPEVTAYMEESARAIKIGGIR